MLAASTLLIVGIGSTALVVVVLLLIVLIARTKPKLEEKVNRLIKEKKYDEAGKLLVEQENYQRAIQVYTQFNRPRQAAQIYLRLGEHQRAAEIFIDLGDHEAAINSYLKVGDKVSASQVLVKSGKFEEAADYLMQAGKMEDAAALYLKAKQFKKSAAVYQELGDKKRAAAIMGALHATEGDFRSAAKSFYVAGQFKKAAESFSRAGLHEHAAKVYERIGEFRHAARARLQFGQVVTAAEHLERIGDLNEAIPLFEAAGKWNKVVECHKRVKNWLALGNIMMRLHKSDLAIEFFKRLTPLDEGYIEAAMSMASILEDTQDLESAKQKYREILEFHGLSTKSAPALFALSKLCEMTNTPEIALPYLREFSTSGPMEEKVRNWQNRLEQMVISAAQTMTVGLEVASEEEMRTRKGDSSELLLPHKDNIADRYDIVEKIGQGGHGVIYKAYDKVLGRMVVLKFLFRNQVPSEMAKMYFLREAKTTASLNHPNIVTLFDMGQVGDNLYIAMEFIDGITLEDRLRDAKGSLPVEEALSIVNQLAEALQYAHDKQIVHRDIKPGNVMLQRPDMQVLKLMDFGLAKALDENPHKTLIICGTPLYMSPEQIVGDFVDHISDIYSFGVLTYQLLVGRTPFPSANILAHHQFTQPPHPTTTNKNIPVEMGDVILKALAKKREDRFQTSLEFAEALVATWEGTRAVAGSIPAAEPQLEGHRDMMDELEAAVQEIADLDLDDEFLEGL